MSIRVALDTDVLDDLDGHAEILMTYSDLIPDHAALAELRAKFPHSEIVLFDRGLGDPTGEATIADIEPGAMAVDQLAEWVADKRAAGKKYLTGYCDRNDLEAVMAIADLDLWHMVATLDGTCHIDGFTPMRQPAVVQILGAGSTGIHADLSLVLEDYWHPRASYALDPFQPAADVPASPGASGGPGSARTDAPDPGSPAAEAPAPLASTPAELAEKAPAWQIIAEGDGSFTGLYGPRVSLTSESVEGLEYRIRQLYPDTIR